MSEGKKSSKAALKEALSSVKALLKASDTHHPASALQDALRSLAPHLKADLKKPVSSTSSRYQLYVFAGMLLYRAYPADPSKIDRAVGLLQTGLTIKPEDGTCCRALAQALTRKSLAEVRAAGQVELLLECLRVVVAGGKSGDTHFDENRLILSLLSSSPASSSSSPASSSPSPSVDESASPAARRVAAYQSLSAIHSTLTPPQLEYTRCKPLYQALFDSSDAKDTQGEGESDPVAEFLLQCAGTSPAELLELRVRYCVDSFAAGDVEVCHGQCDAVLAALSSSSSSSSSSVDGGDDRSSVEGVAFMPILQYMHPRSPCWSSSASSVLAGASEYCRTFDELVRVCSAIQCDPQLAFNLESASLYTPSHAANSSSSSSSSSGDVFELLEQGNAFLNKQTLNKVIDCLSLLYGQCSDEVSFTLMRKV
jgi:hypothetical protein